MLPINYMILCLNYYDCLNNKIINAKSIIKFHRAFLLCILLHTRFKVIYTIQEIIYLKIEISNNHLKLDCQTVWEALYYWFVLVSIIWHAKT